MTATSTVAGSTLTVIARIPARRFWDEDVIEHEIEGLRKAGLEVPDEE